MTDDRKRVAVVVVAHRMYDTLPLCLEGFVSLVQCPKDLIFVDNGSGGELGDWANSHFPDITVLKLERNGLFCGGYNAGIRYALAKGCRFVLIANADTEVFNHRFLDTLIDTANRWPQAAFIGPLVYFREAGVVQNTCLRFPSLWYSALVWLPFRLFPRLFRRRPTTETEVDFLNGVCVLCRAEALHDVGLLDETYGAYVEDADWSWRARKKGWSSVFTPVPSVIHHEEPTGYEHYSLKTFLLKRNTVYWYLKVGKRKSARFYAAFALALARIRGLVARDHRAREQHRLFRQNLEKVYFCMLRDAEPGPWFGPPLGPIAVPTQNRISNQPTMDR